MSAIDAVENQLTSKDLFDRAKRNEFQSIYPILHDGTLMSTDGSSAMQRVQEMVEPKTGNTLFHYACNNGNLEACKVLLVSTLGIDTSFINAPNFFGHAPLFYASSSGNLPLVKWLVSNGADIDADYSCLEGVKPRREDLGMSTPLQVASFKGHNVVVNFLAECNAKLDGAGWNNDTPLHFAVAEGQKDVTRLLLQYGADIHAKNDRGETPIDLASSEMRPLLERSISTYVNSEHIDDQEGDCSVDQDDDSSDSGWDQDMDTSTEDYQLVRKIFGRKTTKQLKSNAWKVRVEGIDEVTIAFDHIASGKQTIASFDAACIVLRDGLLDPVSQVASQCCNSLFRACFGAIASEASYHTKSFHNQRPIIQEIARLLLQRGAVTNEKDASEAAASLLFMVCKSTELIKYLCGYISQSVLASEPTTILSPRVDETSDQSGPKNVSWRLQLVSIKILNAIVSQYRLSNEDTGLLFEDALKLSINGVDNASVYVRTASIDLLIQCLLIRCEETKSITNPDMAYNVAKSWSDAAFKTQKKVPKPSIQAKINNGLKSALTGSKRLISRSNSQDLDSSTSANEAMLDETGFASDSTSKITSNTMSSNSIDMGDDDALPYAEPVHERFNDVSLQVTSVFGDKFSRCVFSNAWAPRVEAISFLQSKIERHQLVFTDLDSDSQEALLRALSTALAYTLNDRVNAVYEAALSLLMEVTISFSSSLVKSGNYDKLHTLVKPLIPPLLVKLGDLKARMHVATEDALLLIARRAGPQGPSLVLREAVSSDRAGSLSSQSAVCLRNKLALVSKLLLEFGVQVSDSGEDVGLAVKVVVQPAFQLCEHKDASVRELSYQIVSDALQKARQIVMPLLDNMPRGSRQKMIAKLVENGVLESDLLLEEVDDFDVACALPRPGTSSGEIRPPTASASVTKHRPPLLSTSLSSQVAGSTASSATSSRPEPLPYGAALTEEQKDEFLGLIDAFGEELVRCLLDKEWSQREAAVREVERQVKCAINKQAAEEVPTPGNAKTLILLAQVLHLGLNDTVARVFQCSLRLFQLVTTEFLPILGGNENTLEDFLKVPTRLVMQKLADTKQRLRTDCFTLLHSMASLRHIGTRRICLLLIEQYEEAVQENTSLSNSPLFVAETLRLLALLVHEAGQIHVPLSLQPILTFIAPAFANKHFDVRNAATDAYAAVCEAAKRDENTSESETLDLQSVLKEAPPAMRNNILQNLYQSSNAHGNSTSPRTTNEDNNSESNKTASTPHAFDTTRLEQILPSEQIQQLLSSESIDRSQAVYNIIQTLVDRPADKNLLGSWEPLTLLSKQLLTDTSCAVRIASFALLKLIVSSPSIDALNQPGYGIPWGEWGVNLIVTSTVRTVIQQSGHESVRVRAMVPPLLRSLMTKGSTGRNAVCNSILSIPELMDQDNNSSVRERKISSCKMQWQLLLRLLMVLELLTADTFTGENEYDHSRTRRKSSLQSATEDILTAEKVIQFLGSCLGTPTPMVKEAALKVLEALRERKPVEYQCYMSRTCPQSLKNRLACIEEALNGNMDNNNEQDVTCVRGSRASHVRRIAALRPPRSVPMQEKEMTVDVFPPPNSAPGKARDTKRSEDTTNAGNWDTFYHETSDVDSREQTKAPIWLSNPSTHKSERRSSAPEDFYTDVRPEMANSFGGSAIGLLKARRRSVGWRNNDDDDI